MYRDDPNFKTYYNLYEKARKLEKNKDTDKALKIYLDILKKYTPAGTAYYNRPAIILEKKKRYEEAIEICLRAIEEIENEKFNATTDDFEHRLERLRSKSAKKFTPNDNKKKIKETKKVTNKKISKSNLNISTHLVQSSSNLIKNNDWFDGKDWHISVAFSESRSKNFDTALTLAKSSPLYNEYELNGKQIYQAFYSKSPDNFKKYLKLYELVQNWKSCHVMINGILIDRKPLGKINYCYGDKCRVGSRDFCFGASNFTDNVFGCHRAMMHESNDPWYSFGSFDEVKKLYYIDKKEIEKELRHRLEHYKFCPALDIDFSVDQIRKLPECINPIKDDNWELSTLMKNGMPHRIVRPVNNIYTNSLNITIPVEVNKKEISHKKRQGLFNKIKGLFS